VREFLCSGKHRKRVKPIRDIADWGERKVREFPADPIEPPEMWANKPDIWAVIRWPPDTKLAHRSKWQHNAAINDSVVAMDASTRRTRGVQRGPRSHQVVEKVRAATMAELARVGFPGLTIEGVAKAANVNRTTIYRRWPSKAALLLAVLEPGLERFDHDPDTGSLGDDLLALMLMIGETAALVRSAPFVEPSIEHAPEARWDQPTTPR
jgi:hypothetical protein